LIADAIEGETFTVKVADPSLFNRQLELVHDNRRVGLALGHVQEGGQPLAPFAPVATGKPELVDGRAQAHAVLDRATFLRPAQGGPEVVVHQFQLLVTLDLR
jgi:hypothetical protein